LRCIKVSTYCIVKKLYAIIKNGKYPGRETIFRAWNSFLKQNNMRIIIEIEKNEYIEKLKRALKGEPITVIRTRKEILFWNPFSINITSNSPKAIPLIEKQYTLLSRRKRYNSKASAFVRLIQPLGKLRQWILILLLKP
jgi:hypothetical protein